MRYALVFAIAVAATLVLGSPGAQAQTLQQPAARWFAIPENASFSTGDTWISGGITYRLYGVQSYLRRTYFTNSVGARLDCGEASLTMLVALIRDLKPMCYTAAEQVQSHTKFVFCMAAPTVGHAAGTRIDLGTALIASGFAFASITTDAKPVHQPYLVAQAVAQKAKSGLWQYADLPDPNLILLKALRK